MDHNMRMTQRILNHALEIITLLTGQGALLQHLSNLRMTEMNKDKKMAERIVNHALEIIYLLTGEYAVDGHKVLMDKNHQTLVTMAVSSTMRSGHHEENLYTVSICEDGKYEKDEKNIQEMEIFSDPCAGRSNVKPSIFSKHEQVQETDERGSLQVKDEEVPINISRQEDTISKTIPEQHCGPTHFVIRDCVTESYYGAILVNNAPKNNESKYVQYADKGLWSHGAICPKEPHLSTLKGITNKEESIMSMKKLGRETAKAMENPKHIFGMKNSSEYRDNSLSYISQVLPQESMLTESRKFECPECGNCFSQKSHLINHRSIHLTVKPFVCSECGKCFKQKTSLVRHKGNHSGIKPFACSECGKCFSQKSNLVYHERIHSGVKPFECAECGKCFRQKSDFVTHKGNHTGVKPFACSECGKCFSKKSNLIYHETIHTGVKPFACSVCAKCFSQKSDLVTHERVHTGEKPFACSECGKCFSRKSLLVSHIRIHTGAKPFSCSECGKCFISSSACARHQRSHTKDKP
ncbi:uncharacterized protein O3C94_004227 isoform 2-T3 [Discoglossus pictus]